MQKLARIYLPLNFFTDISLMCVRSWKLLLKKKWWISSQISGQREDHGSPQERENEIKGWFSMFQDRGLHLIEAGFVRRSCPISADKKTSSIVVVVFIIILCAALSSLTRFATTIHFLASSGAVQWSPLTIATIVNFSDKQVPSLACHVPGPQESFRLVGLIILDLSGAHKRIGCRAIKKALLSYDIPPEFVKWCKLRLIAISCVLFASLKDRARQKRHRPPPDKKSRLSSDMAFYAHEHFTYKYQVQLQRTIESKHKHQTSRLEEA
jgi:hypothetical protein